MIPTVDPRVNRSQRLALAALLPRPRRSHGGEPARSTAADERAHELAKVRELAHLWSSVDPTLPSPLSCYGPLTAHELAKADASIGICCCCCCHASRAPSVQTDTCHLDLLR